ncbi:hypothetical protein ACFYMW_09820 [Streptomyces sp. NPDC006692]
MLAVVLAFPVAMALATGVEAPSTAIAQLGQLGDTGRRRFGRGTLALLVVIVGGLTLALTTLSACTCATASRVPTPPRSPTSRTPPPDPAGCTEPSS